MPRWIDTVAAREWTLTNTMDPPFLNRCSGEVSCHLAGSCPSDEVGFSLPAAPDRAPAGLSFPSQQIEPTAHRSGLAIVTAELTQSSGTVDRFAFSLAGMARESRGVRASIGIASEIREPKPASP